MSDVIRALLMFATGMALCSLLDHLSGFTPEGMRTKLCTEANWQLPSCKDYLEKGIKELKGQKQ